MNKQNVDSTKNLDEIEKSMNNGMSLKTEIIETIKEKEDELIINFITDNTNLCEEHKIPKDKIREVFEFYNTYRNKNLNITCRDYIKEYIDKLVKECENELGKNPYIVNKVIIDKMYRFLDIKDMLDKLYDRPKAKWVATERHLYMCSNCESEYIETSEHNYCPMCGARMEVKND